MSGVVYGISANLTRHISTEHGIKFERNSTSKECFMCPCGVSLVWIRVAHTIVRASREGLLNCSDLFAVIDYVAA